MSNPTTAAARPFDEDKFLGGLARLHVHAEVCKDGCVPGTDRRCDAAKAAGQAFANRQDVPEI